MPQGQHMSGTGFGAPASFIRQRASPACVLPLPAPFVRLRLSSASVFRPSAPFVRLRLRAAGYRKRFLPFCTRPTSENELFPGTEEGFCHSVPVRRAKSGFFRVQEAFFAVLYPSDEQKSSFLGYRRWFLPSCTRGVSFSFDNHLVVKDRNFFGCV